MTLSVEPQALVGFARQVDRAAVDVWEIRSYLNRHANVTKSWHTKPGSSEPPHEQRPHSSLVLAR
ncbi:hypothetical protein ACLQ28_06075 [Micromonospora sp. DT201]|uniref:hypothetical protein n=1 Tax=Micromonospora sp. DT201 TaxID=3393442 RepID=UPI003CF78CB2